jgi:hypothetical protein
MCFCVTGYSDVMGVRYDREREGGRERESGMTGLKTEKGPV